MNNTAQFDQVLDFSLDEIYDAGGIDGFNDLVERVADIKIGFLSNLYFEPVGVTAEGLIRVRVIAEIIIC